MTQNSTPSEPPVDPDADQPTTYDDTLPPEEATAPPEAKPGRKPKAAAPPPGMQKEQLPSVGRVVHFLVPKGMTNKDEPVHRAAFISKVYDKPGERKYGKVDLHVMVCREDYPDNFHPGPILYVQGAIFNDAAEVCGTWHWPERV